MQGDPFGAIKLIDRAKLAYDGVKQWLLHQVEEERKKWEAARTPVVERDVIPADGDDCPQCGCSSTMRVVSAGVVRCMQCAWQPRVTGPPGISRAQLESFTYPDADHKRKFQEGFGSAVARIVGRK